MAEEPRAKPGPFAGLKIEDLPGVRDAVEGEARARAEAFLPGLRKSICGIEVLPLTLDHMALLRLIDSPYLHRCDIPPTRIEIGRTLWCLTPQYATAQSIRSKLGPWFPRLAFRLFERMRKRFIRGLRRLPEWSLHSELCNYLDAAFADAPKGGPAVFRINYFSSDAGLVVRLANEFGWSRQQIMSEPLECIWQYIRAIRKQENPSICFTNRSDEVIGREFEKVKRCGNG